MLLSLPSPALGRGAVFSPAELASTVYYAPLTFLTDAVPIVASRRVDSERQPGGETIPPVPKSLTVLAVLLSRCFGQVAFQTAWRNILA